MNTASLTPDLVRSILGQAFGHFRTNLGLLRTSNNPEVAHQARVGWRRFKSAMRLFKPLLPSGFLSACNELKPVLKALSELRDLDVARFDTLPRLSSAYVAGADANALEWKRLTLIFVNADRQQRQAVRALLQDPGIQGTLADISQCLVELKLRSAIFTSDKASAEHLQAWTQRRVRKIHKQLGEASARAKTAKNQHRVRILAKQLRYSTEMLREVLPRKLAREWYAETNELQTRIGQTRDLMRAASLALELKVPQSITVRLQSIANMQTKNQK